MISDGMLTQQLQFVLTRTDLEFCGEKYEGKVRDSYSDGERRFLVTTDRLSCFDRVVTSIPFKGQVLNQLAVHWFELTSPIVPNHIISIPDPNVMIVKNCRIVPVEVVVRGYLAGSAVRDYQAGREISGIRLPPGLKPYQKLPEAVLTPSTKAEKGSHDEPVSEDQILKRGIVSSGLWGEIRDVAMRLFSLGQEEASRRGLILADTKYEFGIFEDRLILADEIHTLDSSRYWLKETYDQKLASEEAPDMLDKEPTRQWLLAQGFKGDGPVPDFSDEHRVRIARHYIDSYEKITGRIFEAAVQDTAARIRANLQSALLKSRK